jgi:hypothetical protein
MLAVAALLVAVYTPQKTDWVWIEAENAARTNFPPPERNPFAPANAKEADVLSGGKWIGVGDKRTETIFAEYNVDVPSNGAYQVYARKFWKHGPYRWRFDNQPWQSVGSEVALMDSADLRQFTGANWTHAGETTVTKGPHTLRIELTSNDGAAAFDAFILTKGPFIARGKLKPGENYNRHDPGFFAFEPAPDPFKPTPIDLRNLNEKFAGEGGFIGVKGEEFIHKKTGIPEKFWAINTGADTTRLDKATFQNMARSWAKMGVNLVRLHGAHWGSDFRKIEPDELQRIHQFVEILKHEGIYTCLSIYFPLWLNFNEKSPFAGYKGQNPFALLYFNKDFQAFYNNWWRTILTSRSEKTGKTLTEEPAVAMLEIVNEDSNMFWTFTPYENIPAPQMEILEKQFGSWLAKKHGSLKNALQFWGGSAVRGDDLNSGRAGFMPLWEVFNKKDARAQDTARFLAENQRDFYVQTLDLLKKDLGFKGSIYASNWITADARILGPLDKWSNSVADFMDRHGYFDVGHTGERASYSISNGDRYADRSALQFLPNKAEDPPNFSLPIFDIRYNNKPSTITEINWTPPNALRADFPLVSAAYGALQGTDAIFFFATGAPWWEETLGKFGIRTPVTFGQFPATALIYRKGLVKAAPKVVEASLSLSDLFALKGAPLSTTASLDQLRAADIPAGKSAEVKSIESIDPLAFLVGKVDFNITDDPRPSRIMDLSRFISHDKKMVTSATGELLWHYGRGTVTVNAPKAQGVTGYLSKLGTVELGALRIKSPMEYGTILAVSLDDKPLATSKQILLQVMSQEQNYGWRTSGGPQKLIESTGQAPMQVAELKGNVTFKRKDAAALKVTPLDFNGYPKSRAKPAPNMRLSPDTIYYLITK